MTLENKNHLDRKSKDERLLKDHTYEVILVRMFCSNPKFFLCDFYHRRHERQITRYSGTELSVTGRDGAGYQGYEYVQEQEIFSSQSNFPNISYVIGPALVEEESIALKFIWSEILSENLPRLSANYFAARHYLEKEVLPAIDRDLKVLEDSTSETQTDKDDKDLVISWIDRYRREARTLVTDIASFCQIDSDKRNDELNLVLGLICKDFVSDTGLNAVENIGSPLSVKAIQYCVAQENVGCTLVGMRTPEYVHDAVVAAEASHRLTKEDLKAVAQCPLLLAVNADK